MSQTTVVFPHVEGHWTPEETVLQRELARIMVASSKRHMPEVPVKMWTNEHTPPIAGVDGVIRRPTKGFSWIPWVCKCAAEMQGQVLYMDTDVVIQRDLRDFFVVPCDVILTSRGMKEVDGRLMPFIFGVVPYRNAKFWDDVLERVLKMNKVDQSWYGSQMAVFDMYMEMRGGSEKWKIALVDREIYNYTPKNADDAPADKWVLHYKGKDRKSWMLDKWGEKQAVAA